MTSRTACFSFFVLLVACGRVRADDAPAGHVSVSAEPAVVTVEGLPPGRSSIDLPALEYAFEIAVDCAGDARPQSVSVNVADTRVTLSGEEFGEAPAQRLKLTVPASQTALLAIDDFCPAGPPESGHPPAGAPGMGFIPEGGTREPRILEVPGVLSAQVSLVCSDGVQRSMTWTSQPLGVMLACASPAPEAVRAPEPGSRMEE